MMPGLGGDSETASLARAFLRSLRDPQTPWSALFATSATARGLNDRDAQAVKVAVLRLRVFQAADRFRPRPARRTP
jgi:hypothetical protein